ncbi:MAG: preprotein translocase subunit SecY [Chloroflexi bacterium]|nr:preprotein translocase subunit SecY [Chloroflexota bacterium]
MQSLKRPSFLSSVLNAFRMPDLSRKLWFTLLILVIYRLAAHIPMPGVDRTALDEFFKQQPLLGMLDLLSGGAMSNFSIMAMGVYPYVTASIVMQLMIPIFPKLQELQKEGGEAGRQRLNLYTHIMTVPIAALNAIGQALLLARGASGKAVLTNFGFDRPELWLPTLATILTLTCGTMFALWLGELITRDGVGQGISIIIFGGIVAQAPQRLGQLAATNVLGLVGYIVIAVVTVVAIVVVYEGQRRIPVQYGKRVRGTRVFGGQSSHIPMRINQAGMIPLIFAQSILILPGVIASYFTVSTNDSLRAFAIGFAGLFDSRTSTFYWLMYFVMVVGFTFMYTDITFQQQNLPETLQKNGGFIPGIRPGKNTEKYLMAVLRRITLVGAVFLGLVALLPFILRDVTESSVMVITSTGLLIVVGVVLDTMKQLEAQLLMRQYEGFIR